MIECAGLVRTFEDGGDGQTKVALEEVDFVVERGETSCLLGPNGAGKTTLVRILSTILLPTAGTASVGGMDVVDDADAVRRSIRLSLGGDRGFHFGLSVFENVRFWATMYGLGWREATRETNRVLDLVGLADSKGKRADTLSRGMKQRVHLARTLLGDADVLLLDEPTTGMDPVAAKAVRDLVRQLHDDGRTILLTTHNMTEAEELADRVTLLNHGRIEASDTPGRLRELFTERASIVATGVPDDLRLRVEALPTVVATHNDRAQVTFDVEGDGHDALSVLVAGGVTHVRSEPPTLEQVYLQLFGDRGLST